MKVKLQKRDPKVLKDIIDTKKDDIFKMSQETSSSFILVSRWRRFTAFLIDLLIIDVLLVSPFVPAIESHLPKKDVFQFLSQNETVVTSLLALFTVISFFIVAYFTLFEYYLKQTPGKMILRIGVISTAQEIIPTAQGVSGLKDERVTFMQAFFRNLFFIPVFPLNFLLFFDLIFVLFRNRTVSELLSKTATVENYVCNTDNKDILKKEKIDG